MSLRRTTLLLIFGSVYTVVHKAVLGLFPGLSGSQPAGVIASVLWLLATLALVLFAFQFLREVRPRDIRLRYSLIAVIIFTAGVIVSRLPFWSMSYGGLGRRMLCCMSALGNSLAILLFLVSLARLVAEGSPLGAPLRVAIWAFVITAALGLVSAGYLSLYLLTGREVEPLPFLRPFAMLAFLFTYGTTLWFLIRFWHLGSYADLVER